ncbi:MAG: HEPN domain-containing protein [Acidobacteria bacterium]|nr:HEPN domain-containing protein [Acidobacteriota bacterium]
MPARAEDWYKQARHDLEHAGRALEGGDFEWACFAAQQAAEKALKALYQKAGGEARGHSVYGLLRSLPPGLSAETGLLEAGKGLDKHYIPARYPNAYPEGAPYEYYTRGEAERAIGHAEQILGFCERHLV